MDPQLLGEFMGTMILVLIGNSVVSNVVLKDSKGNNSGWIVICTGFMLAVLMGVFTAIACGSKGAHINPAVTLAVAIRTGDFSNLIPFTIAQTLGAMVGQLLVYLNFLPHWGATSDAGGKLACFCTGASIRSFAANVIAEALGTFVLVFVIVAMNLGSVAPGLAPFLVGCVVWGIGLGMGGPTGFAINPARDLGPRIMHAILPIPGKGSSDWGYAAVPIIGPFIGAVVAAGVLKVCGV